MSVPAIAERWQIAEFKPGKPYTARKALSKTRPMMTRAHMTAPLFLHIRQKRRAGAGAGGDQGLKETVLVRESREGEQVSCEKVPVREKCNGPESS
eukprot:1103275-Rhodomonas_salina.1